MKKIFVDLGGDRVGILNEGYGSLPVWTLTLLEGGSSEDGAYCPPQHMWVNKDGLKNLYDALKAIYEPTVVG